MSGFSSIRPGGPRALTAINEIQEENRRKATLLANTRAALAKAFQPGPDHFELVDGKLAAATEQSDKEKA